MNQKNEYKFNPKLKGSGLISCIPQKGTCPNNCPDCFFQSGRSYLEPLGENLPQIPPQWLTTNRIVRMNDGNDSNNDRELVEKTAREFDYYFFNTASPEKLEEYSGPVVLTLNPGLVTDYSFHKVEVIPSNLMFVRVRVNAWNWNNIANPAVFYYTSRGVPVALTFMAYYTEIVPEEYKDLYEWKQRTLNSYWVLTKTAREKLELLFKDNPLVYSCGYKGQYGCQLCGNCIREYYATLERMGGNSERIII